MCGRRRYGKFVRSVDLRVVLAELAFMTVSTVINNKMTTFWMVDVESGGQFGDTAHNIVNNICLLPATFARCWDLANFLANLTKLVLHMKRFYC